MLIFKVLNAYGFGSTKLVLEWIHPSLSETAVGQKVDLKAGETVEQRMTAE